MILRDKLLVLIELVLALAAQRSVSQECTLSNLYRVLLELAERGSNIGFTSMQKMRGDQELNLELQQLVDDGLLVAPTNSAVMSLTARGRRVTEEIRWHETTVSQQMLEGFGELVVELLVFLARTRE